MYHYSAFKNELVVFFLEKKKEILYRMELQYNRSKFLQELLTLYRPYDFLRETPKQKKRRTGVNSTVWMSKLEMLTLRLLLAPMVPL